MAASLAAGQLLPCPKPDTIADGLRGAMHAHPCTSASAATNWILRNFLDAAKGGLHPAGRMGDKTWPIIRDRVDAAVTVSEAEIVAAMRLVFERTKVHCCSCLVLTSFGTRMAFRHALRPQTG